MPPNDTQPTVHRALPKKGVLRDRFENYKDSALDAAMDKGESWSKKVGYGNQGVLLDDIPKLLALLGLKLVDVRMVCVERSVHEAYKALTVAYLAPGPSLDWGSE